MSDRIQDQLVKILARAPMQTTEELLQALRANGTSVSQRAVYKALKHMEEGDIVVKERARFGLQIHYILELLSLADIAYSSHLQPQVLKSQIPERKLTFKSLRRLDLYWINLMGCLQELYPHEPTYLWCPLQWFPLVHDHTAQRFYQIEEQAHYKRFHVIGKDVFLNRRALESLPKQGTYAIDDSYFSKYSHMYLCAIGPYVIEVHLGKKRNKHLEDLFMNICKQRELTEEALQRALSGPDTATLTVLNETPRSKRIKKLFETYWQHNITTSQ